MDVGASKRLGVIAGGGVFILTLLAQLTRPDLTVAVLVALASGTAVGLLAYLAGVIVALATPPQPLPPEPVAAEPAREDSAIDRLAGLEETQRIGGGKSREGDEELRQTVRLDEAGMGETLPGLTAEELKRERENLLKALNEPGIEGPSSASENG